MHENVNKKNFKVTMTSLNAIFYSVLSARADEGHFVFEARHGRMSRFIKAASLGWKAAFKLFCLVFLMSVC